MNSKIVIFILVSILLLEFSYGATIHGALYDSSYHLITDAEVVINSSPKQNDISSDGLYFFYVPTGTYEITVEKYIQKQLVFSEKKIVDITKDGEFRIDIMMEPLEGIEIPSDDPPEPGFIPRMIASLGIYFYIIVGVGLVLVLVMAFFIWYYVFRKKRFFSKVFGMVHLGDEDSPSINLKIAEPGESISLRAGDDEFKHDIDGVIKVIRDEGGRTTQKDIRRKIPLSEAKISLMISELEANGKIQKIKKGRGNIIVLKENSG